MAASIKVSELQSLTTLTGVDLFLVSDMESGTSRRVSYTDLHTNLTTDLQSALDSLTDTVGQNKQDAESLVESIRSSLQGAIDTNETHTADVDAQIRSELATKVTELTDLINAKVQEVIDLAPESLDTLNELAQALQDNPDVIAALQTSVADEQSRAETAETLLQNNIDAEKVRAEGVESTLTARLDTLVEFAPENLDTLNELAQALQDNPDVITTLQADLVAYKQHIEDRNLELALAFDVPTYAKIIYGG